MMETFLKFIAIIFTAALAENALFGRALITRKMLFPSGKMEIAVFAMGVTGIIGISGILCYFADLFLYPLGIPIYRRSVVYILIIALTHLSLGQLLQKKGEGIPPQIRSLLQKTLLLASFNVAVLGTVLICTLNRYSPLMRIGYFIGTGLGVTVALGLIFVGRQNITMSNVPRSFRGLPITLIYIGMLSLAIYGLIGHQLPY